MRNLRRELGAKEDIAMLMTSLARLRGSTRIVWTVLLLALVLLAALAFQYSAGVAQPSRAVPVRVTGTLKLVVPRAPSIVAASQVTAIALPDQKVFLRSAAGIDV